MVQWAPRRGHTSLPPRQFVDTIGISRLRAREHLGGAFRPWNSHFLNEWRVIHPNWHTPRRETGSPPALIARQPSTQLSIFTTLILFLVSRILAFSPILVGTSGRSSRAQLPVRPLAEGISAKRPSAFANLLRPAGYGGQEASADRAAEIPHFVRDDSGQDMYRQVMESGLTGTRITERQYVSM